MKNYLLIVAILPSFLLAEASPKFPCGISGTLEERISDCNETITIGNNPWSIVSRYMLSDERLGFFARDNQTGLIWSQFAPLKKIKKIREDQDLEDGGGSSNYWKAARTYCEDQNFLGMMWDLPTASTSTVGKEQLNLAIRHGMVELFEMRKAKFWSKSPYMSYQIYYDGIDNEISFDLTFKLHSAMCVSDGTIYSSTNEASSFPRPCGQSGSIEERIADCAETRISPKGHPWSVVSRFFRGNQRMGFFIRDDQTKLIWSYEPEQNELRKIIKEKNFYFINDLGDKDGDFWSASRYYCKNIGMKEIGKEGRLPITSWELAGDSPLNEMRTAHLHEIRSILELQGYRWWTQTLENNEPSYFLFYDGTTGGIDWIERNYPNGVRCVTN